MWRDSESEQDFLNFTEVADQIATLATRASLLPISIGVFGGWGTGKSTVLRLVERRIADIGGEKPPIVVKFDAWLYQGFDDARAALMEVVARDLIALAEKKKTLVDRARAFAGRVNYFRALGLITDFGVGMALGIPPGLLTSAGAAVSSIARGAFTMKEYEGLKEEAAGAADVLGQLVRPQEKKTPPEEIEAFRREFGDLLEGLDTSMVLFIDNLDRCLPDVAIGTLEAIRLFLFMPRTAFVIAADEGMIRHSVAKHFSDPQASHVRDYLDKVIQVPLRVPQVGSEDVRAYMYALFVGLEEPDALPAVQAKLLEALQGGWKGETFTKTDIATLANASQTLLDNLAIADRLAPILAWAPNVQGNPRIVKRLLNAIMLRQLLAKGRRMSVDLATLAKLALFERCTDEEATLALYRLVMEGKGAATPPLIAGGDATTLPKAWAAHADFVAQWQVMEPVFDDVDKLKPAVFLSRDVMAPARSRFDLEDRAKEAFEALLKVDRVTSPVGAAIVEQLSSSDRQKVMSKLIEEMRGADWKGMVAGLHGAIMLSQKSSEAFDELSAFVSTLSIGSIDKGAKYLLKQAKLIEGS
jgi:predicted KAP-like P-loop ATPase